MDEHLKSIKDSLSKISDENVYAFYIGMVQGYLKYTTKPGKVRVFDSNNEVDASILEFIEIVTTEYNLRFPHPKS